MCEQSIIGARASVMVYDDVQKKWIPSGSSSGLSKVQIYHHQQNNTFRVVGRKLQDHEVVINCSILKGLKYNQATATFHQWRDSKSVYGLNFSSQQDAEAFARAMKHALEVLSNRAQNGMPPLNQQVQQHVYDEDMGYRTMTREDAAIMQQNGTTQSQQQPQHQQQHQGPLTPTPQPGGHVPQSPPTPQGHHRTSSAPPAPQPPPMSMPGQQPQYAQQGPPPQQQQQIYAGAGGYGPGNGGVIPMAPQQQMPLNNNNAGMPYQQQQQPMFASSNSQQNLQQMHQNGGAIYMAVGHNMSAGDGGGMLAMNNGTNSAGGYAVGNLGPQGGGGMIPHPPTMGNMNFGPPNGGSATVVDAPIGHIPAPPQMPAVNSGGGPAGGGVPPPPPPPAFGNMNGGGVPQPPQPPAMPAAVAPQTTTASTVPVAPPMGLPGGPGGVPPPPPPIPMNLGGGPPQMDMSSLAAQLQSAKLKRGGGGNKAPNAPPPPVENSGSSTSSGGSGNYGTIGKSTNGMASMMDEMQKTLARRRAQAEKKEPEPGPMDDCAGGRKPWEKSNTLPHKSNSNSNGSMSNSNSNAGGSGSSGAESPRPSRKRFGSASEETILKQVNGDGLSLPFSAELDNLKAEILREIRTEIQKAKQEILDVIKLEFNRR